MFLIMLKCIPIVIIINLPIQDFNFYPGIGNLSQNPLDHSTPHNHS